MVWNLQRSDDTTPQHAETRLESFELESSSFRRSEHAGASLKIDEADEIYQPSATSFDQNDAPSRWATWRNNTVLTSSGLSKRYAQLIGNPLNRSSPSAMGKRAKTRANSSEYELDSDDDVTKPLIHRVDSRGGASSSGTPILTTKAYFEQDPTVSQYIYESIPSWHDFQLYTASLFPFIHWVPRYNTTWLIGDVIAGVTVAGVLVPQAMAYASLANLAPQFGLYSSFCGGLTYWLFSTAKDINIGPIAVMATIVGNVVVRVHEEHPDVPEHAIASLLALVSGIVLTIFGLLRLGWLIEFISMTAISAFMTGSAITIAATQIPTLLGVTGFTKRGSAISNIVKTLANIKTARIDALLGLTALALLYFIKYFSRYMEKRHPKQKRIWFFISTLRTVVVIACYTFFSFLINRNYREHPVFDIAGKIPRGLQEINAPLPGHKIFKAILGDIPIACIVLLIEHVSLAKAFGRENNYKSSPSQEMIGIGTTNVLGAFFGAFPATGSFSRTAINAKAGVRTPFGGVITSVLVLLAIYLLPAVFFYIPKAPLAAVIIHAVGDLITRPSAIKQFWKVSPIEVPLFVTGVLIGVFYSIETGVYVMIFLSFLILLYRGAKAKGSFLGEIQIRSVVGDHIINTETVGYHTLSLGLRAPAESRHIFLPLEINSAIRKPYPGVFIFRFSEVFNYHNANQYLEQMVRIITAETKRTKPLSKRPSDQAWSCERTEAEGETSLPTLKALVFDFSAVNHVDYTSVHALIDTRHQLEQYAAPDMVQFHFAHVNNAWTRRALVAAGFGRREKPKVDYWRPIFSITENEKPDAQDEEKAANEQAVTEFDPEPIDGINRPYFHADISGALHNVLLNVEAGMSKLTT
jgi:sodium-independent sulfate anion transporter 11